MITSGIIYLIYGILLVITSPIRLLPDASLPDDLASSLQTAGSYLNSVSGFLPITTIFLIFSFVLAIEVFVFGWKIFNWVRKLLPTQS